MPKKPTNKQNNGRTLSDYSTFPKKLFPFDTAHNQRKFVKITLIVVFCCCCCLLYELVFMDIFVLIVFQLKNWTSSWILR